MMKLKTLLLILLTCCFGLQAQDKKLDKKSIFYRVKMIDGSLIRGQLLFDNLQIKTRFGELTVPVSDVLSIYPGLKHQEKFKKEIEALARKMGHKDKKEQAKVYKKLQDMGAKIMNILKGEMENLKKKPRENRRCILKLEELIESFEIQVEDMDEQRRKHFGYIQEDRLVTKKFTIVGAIDKTEFKFKSEYGVLNIKFSKLSRLSLRRGGEQGIIKKTFKILAADNHNRYKDIAIRVKVGDKIKVKASGVINIDNYGYSTGPDGNSSSMGNVQGLPAGMLVARIGKSGTIIPVGSSKVFIVKKAGKLYFANMFNTRYINYGVNGSYEVQIKVYQTDSE